MDDWRPLGRGTVVGICSNARDRSPAAISPIPGFKDVPDLARLGFPIGEVAADGDGRRSPRSRMPAGA